MCLKTTISYGSIRLYADFSCFRFQAKKFSFVNCIKINKFFENTNISRKLFTSFEFDCAES